MSDLEEYWRQHYGDNLELAKKNSRLGLKRARLELKERYPNAHVRKFSFDVTVRKTGKVEGTSVYYKINDEETYDITSDTFKRLYSDALDWLP